MNNYTSILLLISISFIACQNNDDKADAYGNFEATEIVVSAEGNGRLIHFDVEEGRALKKGQLVGITDTVQLHLKRTQLSKHIQTIRGKTTNVQPQLDVLEDQKRVLLKELNRIQNLIAVKAATSKQLDDIQGQIDIIDKKIIATKDQFESRNSGILGEISPVELQIEQIEDQLRRSYIQNPVEGVVITKLVEESEIVGVGKPLYTIADTRIMTLRAYISGKQLSSVKIGQQVEVLIDDQSGEQQALEGSIKWISSEAEFTPKIVQTREERVNLVYAMKIDVVNDGKLKIGMPAEINFNKNSSPESK